MTASLANALAQFTQWPTRDEKVFDQTVDGMILASRGECAALELLKAKWDTAVRSQLSNLLAELGTGVGNSLSSICNLLDFATRLATSELAENSLALDLVRTAFEAMTVEECSRMFSWLEIRGAALIEDYRANSKIASRKVLLLLRSLNDLLRALSQTTEPAFRARIMTFLSIAFPLSEKSAINLRGAYGPAWTGPPSFSEAKDAILADAAFKVDEKSDPIARPTYHEMMNEQQKQFFFNTFWFLQYPFSQPTLFAEPDTLKAFKCAVDLVLPVISEASKRERAQSGAIAVGSKRKLDQVTDTPGASDNFSVQYLTSPQLLELQLRGVSFRRQVLCQLLILFQHLGTFTSTAKATWMNAKNRSIQMEFIFAEGDENWAKEVQSRIMLELRTTSPDGRAFAEMITTILEREKSWIQWKSDLCPSFEKPPWPAEKLEEGKRKRRKVMEEWEEWPHSCGSAQLSEAWLSNKYENLESLEFPRPIPDAESLYAQYQRRDAFIANRKAQLEAQAKRMSAKPPPPVINTPAPVPAPVTETKPESHRTSIHPSLPPKPGTASVETQPKPAPPAVEIVAPVVEVLKPAPPPAIASKPDPKIEKWEEEKQIYRWLALRSASRQHLNLFNKIGKGEIGLLVQKIQEQREADKKRDEAMPVDQAVDENDAVAGESDAEDGDKEKGEQAMDVQTSSSQPKSQPQAMEVDT